MNKKVNKSDLGSRRWILGGLLLLVVVYAVIGVIQSWSLTRFGTLYENNAGLAVWGAVFDVSLILLGVVSFVVAMMLFLKKQIPKCVLYKLVVIMVLFVIVFVANKFIGY